MSPEAPPRTVFVERRTYRRRRMADACSLLPVLGIALLAIPLLWHGPPEAPTRTTTVMLYVFGVWALLIAVSALVSRGLRSDPAPDREAGGTPPDAG
jgi:hypothetical protein